MNLNKIFIILIISLSPYFLLQKSFALEPGEALENKAQELRAREISKNIRCLVCQNQSIDESNAPLAKDLRILIRKKITSGKNDNEIYKFLSDRYGDFILLNPPINLNTIVLWFFPFIFVFIGILIVYLHNKKSKKN